MTLRPWTCALVLATGFVGSGTTAFAETRLTSSTSYLSEDLKARQADETANPGMLWVGEGEDLWNRPEGPDAKACASCHGAAASSMRGVSVRYPAVDTETGKLLNLELRINACRTRHQSAEAFPYESDELLALTAYITRQSKSMPLSPNIEGAAAPFYEQGRSLFYLRQGQINLSCAQCHDENAGHHLRGDTISSGIPAGYPAYRLEWQTLGSLHRRLRACALGVRAVQFPYGSDELVSLELFLAKRAQGFAVEAPAIRK